MAQRVNYSGLVIAGIGFFLTRFTVVLVLDDPVRFYVAGIVPLLLGLGLAAFGVALTVGSFEPSVVRTVAVWCVIGTAGMLSLVVLTLVGSTTGGMSAFMTPESRASLSTFLIGGSVGGTLTGLYASLNRRQRTELERQANRLEVLNRLLRHEILNAVTVIRGYAPMIDDRSTDAVELIQTRSDDIESTIDEVQYLARSARAASAGEPAVDLRACLVASVDVVRSAHPDATVQLGDVPGDLRVHANPRLEHVFTELLETAVRRTGGEGSSVSVGVDTGGDVVRVSVRYTGEALTPAERSLLERGEIGEYDDPSSGFELNVIRLLVESYQGAIETRRRGDRERVTVVLPRAGTAVSGHGLLSAGVSGVRPAVPTLVVTMVAALVAGVTYGITSEFLGGSIAGIGVFYGASSPLVGWITHQFHSVVFGFVFAGLVSIAPNRHRGRYGSHVAIGTGWGVVLWIVAAGVIAPLWLRLLGFEAPIPAFSFNLFVTHVVWGITLGLLTAWGYRNLTPWPSRSSGARSTAPE